VNVSRPYADLAARRIVSEVAAAGCVAREHRGRSNHDAIDAGSGALRACRRGRGGAYRVKPEEMESWLEARSATSRRPSADSPPPTTDGQGASLHAAR
jgi:hypothetical protein